MKRLLLALPLVALPLVALAETTVLEYKGQPPPTAMAPSLSAMGQDICAVPISGAVSSTVIGVAGGTVVSDKNCERIKLSKVLNDLGLKVAAVAVLCQDERVWEAMEMSGSPCPVGGAIGDTARDAWKKMKPERFERLYGKAVADIKPAVE